MWLEKARLPNLCEMTYYCIHVSGRLRKHMSKEFQVNILYHPL